MNRPTRVPSPSAAQTQYADHPHAEATFDEVERPNNIPAVAKPRQQAAPSIPDRVEEPQATLPVTGFANLAAAIANVMEEIKPVEKSGWNDFHKYNYARMQDLSAELTPLMGKHGVVIFQNELDRNMFDEDRAMAVRYQFTIVHKSGEIWPERPIITGVSMCRTSNGKYDDKAFNKCHTSARKYFLLSLFQIPTDDAEDADNGGQGGGEQRSRPRRQVPSPGGKLQPHTIPIIDGEAPQSWSERFCAHVAKAASSAEIDQWYNTNAATFDKLKGRAVRVYDDAVAFMDAIAARLESPSKSPDPISSGKPESDFPGDKPLPPKDDGLDIPAALRRAPKPTLTEYESDWLLGLGGAFSGCEDFDSLSKKQDKLMKAERDNVSDYAWQQAEALLAEHLERVNEGG